MLRETLEGQLRDQINETELLRKRLESEHQLRLQKLEEAKRAAERQVIGKRRNALGGLFFRDMRGQLTMVTFPALSF